jgi:tripartite-type tricarboxylate transporter receptor subunit TctC
MKIKYFLFITVLLIALFGSVLPSHGETYPSKPIRMIVGFSPGGSTDVLARTLAQKLSEAWKQPVIVENKPGAGGLIGADLVAKSAPDGYTLTMGPIGPHAVNASLYKKMPYDTLKDFAPVVHFANVTMMLVVNPALPVHSVKELIEYARAHPGKLNFASGGIATSQHLSAELFISMTKVNMLHIPYKGTGNALPDLLGGRTQLMFADLPAAISQIKAGKLRPIAVCDEKRLPELPDIPTVAEAGLPGYKAFGWFGVFAPARTPKAVITKLNQEINKILRMNDMKERLTSFGAHAVGGTPEALRRLQEAEMKRWDKIIKAANIQVE